MVYEIQGKSHFLWSHGMRTIGSGESVCCLNTFYKQKFSEFDQYYVKTRFNPSTFRWIFWISCYGYLESRLILFFGRLIFGHVVTSLVQYREVITKKYGFHIWTYKIFRLWRPMNILLCTCRILFSDKFLSKNYVKRMLTKRNISCCGKLTVRTTWWRLRKH